MINPTFEEQRATVTLRGDASPEVWDPSTGEIRSPGPTVVEDGTTRFDLVLPPVGSTFLVVGEPSTHPKSPLHFGPSCPRLLGI